MDSPEQPRTSKNARRRARKAADRAAKLLEDTAEAECRKQLSNLQGRLRAVTVKSNAWRHNIQRLYCIFLSVNLGKNLGIDLEKFCGTGPWSFSFDLSLCVALSLLCLVRIKIMILFIQNRMLSHPICNYLIRCRRVLSTERGAEFEGQPSPANGDAHSASSRRPSYLVTPSSPPSRVTLPSPGGGVRGAAPKDGT